MSAHRNSLTRLEDKALRSGLNASDGHPRMPLTESQEHIVADLPSLFHQAQRCSFEEVEERAQRAFLHGIGQLRAPIATGRLVSCYSSSTAMDIVARTLAERTSAVALIHPTFDNIADLLRARGLMLYPVAECEFDGEIVAELPDMLARCSSLLRTTRPAGCCPPMHWPGSRSRVNTGRVLALDTCFRAHDPRSQYDTYDILENSGVEWVIIEDTGKVWPMLELKAGFLSWGERTDLALLDAFSDILLTMSPVILLLVQRLAEDGVLGGYRDLHRLLAATARC